VITYAGSAHFQDLQQEAAQVQGLLAAVRYCLEIKGSTVKVRACTDERDYGAEVQQTFARFTGGNLRDYRVTFSGAPEANAVEGLILDRVALLYSEIFAQLAAFCARRRDYLDPALAQFDREVQFYLAYGAYTASLRRQGLPLCYPAITEADGAVDCQDAYDIALAYKLAVRGGSVVCNDFALTGPERLLVVTGPNQGGKTTFARSFGQLHYLASLGIPVAARAAQLLLCDRVLTHFEMEENTGDLRSKLEDDLVRLQQILAQATPRSILILNEVFSSTTLQDALDLGRRLMAKLSALDVRGVYVTFVEELAGFDAKTVSMVSTVAPENPTQRIFRIVRRPPDGLAYAHSLAEKHGLTYARIKERIGT
jgi:DNA mismatch repair ATPase MutS